MPKKGKRKKKAPEEMSESWLLPYADLMTLLLALFIVLFASSTIDETKLEKLSAVFSEIFDSGNGIMENSSPTPMPVPTPDNASYVEDRKSLEEIQDRVEEYIAVYELENQFDTLMTDEGLLVTIRDSILFNPGRADIREEYLPLADDLATLLVFDPPRHIVVTGHTDNVPMNSPQFESNWDLSVMRAVNFLKLMIDNQEVDPSLFSAKGYGEFQPIASNDTVEGKNQNRRVEILIQPLVLEDGSKKDFTP